MNKPSPVSVRSLHTVHYIDLCSGFAQLVRTDDVPPSMRRFCLEHWQRAAQGRFAPVPEVRGTVVAGYTMRGQVVATPGQPASSPRRGGLLRIQDPRGVLVSTVAFAWRPTEGAFLWRRLVQYAQSPVRPMEYPLEPWIARRQEPGAARNAAMLATLAFVEYAIGVAWLERALRQEA